MTSNDTIRMQELFSDTGYIEWLCDFLVNHKSPSMDEWTGDSLELSEQDKQNIQDMNLFYNGIESYAEKNGIRIINGSDEEFYMVQYRDFCFKLGHQNPEWHNFLFFKQIDFDERCAYIDFSDVLGMYSKTIGGKKKR